MSELYPDLINNFPNDIDPNRKFQDVTSANKALVLQYYTYKEAGNDAAATDLLNTNPALKDTIVTAEMIQYIYDMNVSQQRFYLNDVQTYLVNLVKPKGYFSETTKYTKYDTVQYTVNGAIQSYMGAKVDIPIGTPPTNTTYFDPITLRGEKGASGTGLSVRGVWNSLDTYYVNDCVSLNNAMWYAIVENTNNAPNDLSTYWKKFADLPSPIRVSTTQPASQNVGDEWHQISDTDNSLAIKVKQADGSYVAKNVVSNASFISDSNTAGVIHTYTHSKNGTVHNLIGTGRNIIFFATAGISEGDTWQVNGVTKSATLSNGDALTTDLFKSGNWVNCIYDGTKLNFFGGGSSALPNYSGKLTVHVATSDGGSVGSTRVRITNVQLGANYIQTLDALGNTTFNLLENHTYYVVLLDYPSSYYGGATNVTVTGGSTQTVTITLKTQPDIVGWRMNVATGAVEYTDGAENWLAASMGDTFDPGSWGDSWLFKNIKPCMLKGGVVQYYLNPNDFSKKVDGTAADITTGADGDVMIEFPMVYYKFYSETDINGVTWIGCRFSLTSPDSTYCANAFLSQSGVIQNTMYMAAYDGFTYNNALRSLSGKAPSVLQTIGTFRTQATANGTGYQQQEWSKRVLLQAMFVMMFKGTNSQALLGKGVTSASVAINTGTMDTKGMYWGDQTGTAGVKFCGIENFWGNISKFCDGLILVSGSSKYKIYGTYNDTATGYTTGVTMSTSLSTYIDTINISNGYGMIPKTVVSEDASSKFHDRVYTSTGTNICYTGGDWSYAAYAGLFSVGLGHTASVTNADIGAALSFTPQ